MNTATRFCACVVLWGAGFSANAATEQYHLYALYENANAHPAPSDLLAFMAKQEHDTLQTCKTAAEGATPFTRFDKAGKVIPFTADFGAVRIDLNSDEYSDYLVFPSGSCPDFFGAHAVRYWIVLGGEHPRFRLVWKSAEDMITLQQSRHHGLRDIVLFYGARNTTPLHFDGTRYQSTSKD